MTDLGLPVTGCGALCNFFKKMQTRPLGSLAHLTKKQYICTVFENKAFMKQLKLQIGEFSRLCGVTIKTLRHYEKLGLLIPEHIDRYSGYRYYSVGQMQKMGAIRELKSLGFSLVEIVDLYKQDTHYPDPAMLVTKIASTEQQLAQLQTRHAQLLAILNARKKHEAMEKFTIQALPSCTVASYKGSIRNYSELGSLCCEVIGPEMARLGCECPEPGFCFTRELGNEYKPESIDIEYCERVKEAKVDSELIHFYELPSVETAICYKHYGPYERLIDAYAEVFAYAEKEGYTILESPRAVYVDGIWNQENPDLWLTIVQLPVTK
jgi:DNA-binding transcriptional MerR regulator/effector-binding domain-containing protein